MKKNRRIAINNATLGTREGIGGPNPFRTTLEVSSSLASFSGTAGENKASPLGVPSSIALGCRKCNVCRLTSPVRLHLSLPRQEASFTEENCITSPVNKIRRGRKPPISLGLCVYLLAFQNGREAIQPEKKRLRSE